MVDAVTCISKKGIVIVWIHVDLACGEIMQEQGWGVRGTIV
jgi:hypothetical protein